MFKRHDLVWLHAAGWDGVLAGLSPADAALAARWRTRSLPVVVRRNEPDLAPDHVCLGLPAPPDPDTGHKRRVAFAVARAHVASFSAPLAVAEAALPAGWSAAHRSLAHDLHEARVDCRVFGSVAMQSLSGEAYLRPGSDIDVLLRPANAAQLDAGLALLARHAHALPLDGEVEFPSGQAVAWKEWLGGDDRVLAKHVDGVALVRRDALLAQFNGERHA